MQGKLNHAFQERTHIEKGRFRRGQTGKSAIGHHKVYQAFSRGMNGFQPLSEFFILLGRRKGEIAIRKVNGAEAGHILQMLCRDVFIIALPAVVIGVMLSWQIGNVWVSSNFKDILFISPLVYIGVVIVALAFILGTVIVKSWHVANENPVVSIKSE